MYLPTEEEKNKTTFKRPRPKDTPDQAKVRVLMVQAGFPTAAKELNFRHSKISAKSLLAIWKDFLHYKAGSRYKFHDPVLEYVDEEGENYQAA